MATTRKKPRKSRPRKINHAVIILDRSGSMATIRQEAVDAFNQQLETIRKATKGRRLSTKVTFVTFDTAPNEPLYFTAPLSKIKALTLADFEPRGMTAMLDAVGLTLSRLRDNEDFKRDTTTALVTVISDGQENNSRYWTWNSVAELIRSLQATNRWTFTYAGANQDLSKVSQNLNIPLGNTLSFNATQQGYRDYSRKLSVATDVYYSSVVQPRGRFMKTANFYKPDDKSGK